jgi:hypothetical protein
LGGGFVKIVPGFKFLVSGLFAGRLGKLSGACVPKYPNEKSSPVILEPVKEPKALHKKHKRKKQPHPKSCFFLRVYF